MPTSDDALFFTSATQLAERLRQRELSPIELMRATLQRIEAVNSKLNAFVSIRPEKELLDEARQVGDRLVRGEDVGPLAGLPLGVKDLEDAVGLPTTQGSLLFKGVYPQRDTVQVERLRRAGAIVIGKTNTPEFGYTAFTTNRVFGTTRNPWNLDCTPGGSSGGSSSAVAGGLVALATASDGGGSVRIPASFTGLVGLKPTNGRIPWGPEEILRYSGCVVSGPLTRSVRDAALWLDVTVGEHPADPYSLPHPGVSYRDVIEREPGALRIAYSPDLGFARPALQVRREVEAALRALEGVGHRVEPAELHMSDPVLEWVALTNSEELARLTPHLQDESLLDPGYVPALEFGRQVTPESMGHVLRRRQELVASLEKLFARVDLLATPTVASPPFPAAGPLPFEVDGEAVDTPGGSIAFTYPFNFSGNPAISLRAGFTDDGLPVGLQLVAPRLREDLLLQVARQYEQARPWAHEWPDL
jgi:aspartyl-tRNA(Asn)/glutamyl-tRNA(Gln) amidotransferase subunit A